MENKKFLDLRGLGYYNGKIQNKLDEKADSSSLSNYYTKPQTDANILAEATARQSADAGLQSQIATNRMNGKFAIKKQYLAHRGCDNIAPENTIPAFEYVAKVGTYCGCETDVRRTYDGKFIIMHDETVDRTTNGTGTVSEMLWSTIQNLVIDDGAYISEYSNLRVPTLAEYLDVMKKHGLMPVIEIKDAWDSTILAELVQEVSQKGLLYSTIFASYNRNVATGLQALDNNINVALLTDTYDAEIEAFVIAHKLNLFISGTVITDQIVETMHENGLKVCRFVDYDDTTNADYLMCADITRCRVKDEYYQGIPVSSWELDQIKKYGNSFNGRLLTFVREGHTNEANDFPEYYQSSNNLQMVSYNTISASQANLVNYNIPVGYDLEMVRFNTPNSTVPYTVQWITGDGTDHNDVNITWGVQGVTIVFLVRRTDLAMLNYRDIEYIRKNLKIWLSNR